MAVSSVCSERESVRLREHAGGFALIEQERECVCFFLPFSSLSLFRPLSLSQKCSSLLLLLISLCTIPALCSIPSPADLVRAGELEPQLPQPSQRVDAALALGCRLEVRRWEKAHHHCSGRAPGKRAREREKEKEKEREGRERGRGSADVWTEEKGESLAGQGQRCARRWTGKLKEANGAQLARGRCVCVCVCVCMCVCVKEGRERQEEEKSKRGNKANCCLLSSATHTPQRQAHRSSSSRSAVQTFF